MFQLECKLQDNMRTVRRNGERKTGHFFISFDLWGKKQVIV